MTQRERFYVIVSKFAKVQLFIKNPIVISVSGVVGMGKRP
jgi:hypothetical protein